MAIISVKNLLEAGVHFGHRISRWNPKMSPYIFGKRNLIHIIDLRETVKGMIKAHHFLKRISAEGKQVILVGTKRQAKSVISREAQRAGMHYVSERWLGGTLTNFETIRKRLARLEELEKMEQDGTMEALSKKLASSLKREKRKIDRNLQGIKNMESLPGALIIVDPKKEHIAIKEAAKLGIPTIALIDTDSDPDLVDIPIPGNDDAMRAIEVICSKLTDAVVEGHNEWLEKYKLQQKQEELDKEREIKLKGEISEEAPQNWQDKDKLRKGDKRGKREVRGGVRDAKRVRGKKDFRRNNQRPDFTKDKEERGRHEKENHGSMEEKKFSGERHFQNDDINEN